MVGEWIRRRVSWMAPERVYPGEEETLNLAHGALRALRGQELAKEYAAHARE